MNQAIKMAGAAVVGAGIGYFVGYKILEKRLAEAFDERLEQETSKMREFYEVVKKPYATPEEAVEALIPEAPEGQDPREKNLKTAYHKIVKKEYVDAQADEQEAAAAVEEIHNIFDKPAPDPREPYVIAEDDFMGNDNGFGQSTLTWYAVDDVLVDERDEIIASPNDTIGEKFRTQFGEDSRDQNIVYIRHEKLGLEFEVVRSEGSYKREVLGEESG